MIRPARFTANPDTLEDNAFQSPLKEGEPAPQKQAVAEFDKMVALMRSRGIDVQVFEDTEHPIKPDAIFPNNWISTHANGILITYPMYSPNRREERSEELVASLEAEYDVDRRYSFEFSEQDGMYLEGTGSMVLDRVNKICYCCISERTDIRLVDRFCLLMGYRKISFHATDRNGIPIYHTNVMMALADEFAIVCLDSIAEPTERKAVENSLKQSGKQIISINFDQLEHFAGNALELADTEGNSILLLSKDAHDHLKKSQLDLIQKFSELLIAEIPTIEKYGGGSVRCMVAENFLPLKE